MRLSGKYIRFSFAGEMLAGAELCGTFIDVDFTGADLSGARLNGTFIHASFDDADLTDADLRDGRFVHVDFSNAYQCRTKLPSALQPLSLDYHQVH